MVLSEGAEWEGYKVQEYGEPDAFGHRKKASVAESLSDEIKQRTGEETIVSDLTYDLRSGEPDFVDKLVASTFGTMAFDAVLAGPERPDGGARRRAVRPGAHPRPEARARARWTSPPCTTPSGYRPNYANKLGLPVFLNRI